MQAYEYKGFMINPNPRLSFASDCWMICLTISRNGREKSFSIENSFVTRAQAAFYSIHYGKKIIDGEIDELNIADIL